MSNISGTILPFAFLLSCFILSYRSRNFLCKLQTLRWPVAKTFIPSIFHIPFAKLPSSHKLKRVSIRLDDLTLTTSTPTNMAPIKPVRHSHAVFWFILYLTYYILAMGSFDTVRRGRDVPGSYRPAHRSGPWQFVQYKLKLSVLRFIFFAVGPAVYQMRPVKAFEILGSALDPSAQMTSNVLSAHCQKLASTSGARRGQARTLSGIELCRSCNKSYNSVRA